MTLKEKIAKLRSYGCTITIKKDVSISHVGQPYNILVLDAFLTDLAVEKLVDERIELYETRTWIKIVEEQ